MSILRRLRYIVRDQGLRGVAAKLLGKPFDYLFEWRYGLDTLAIAKLDGLTITSGDRRRGGFYEGSRWLPLRGLFAELRAMTAAGGALVDLGCGKGKVLLVAAQSGFAQVRGVEFAHELCEIARANWERFRQRTQCPATVEIVEADVAQYAIRPDETVFFLFNPFDEIVLARVLEHVAASVAAHPRRVLIVVAYLSAHYRQAFERQTAFKLEREIVSWACTFSVFSNHPAERSGASRGDS
jgi:SAM-dependent methyltransferase